jgi:hypothetical protein
VTSRVGSPEPVVVPQGQADPKTKEKVMPQFNGSTLVFALLIAFVAVITYVVLFAH